MMSRSEDGSDDGRKSPEQTLPSSKEGVVPESALTSATLNNATVSKEPERALRSQTQRAAKLGGGASGGARHVQSSTTFDRVKPRKRVHSEMDGGADAVLNRTTERRRRSTRLKPTNKQAPYVSTSTTKRALDVPVMQDMRRRSARLQAKAVGLRREPAGLPRMQPNKQRRRKSARPNGSV
jgi:hypothetical protein